MKVNVKTRTLQIDNDVYERMGAIAHKLKSGNDDQFLAHDEKVTNMLNNIANTYYKNYLIDNLLF